jgi:isopentenyl-diphosphate delta-isomerase
MTHLPGGGARDGMIPGIAADSSLYPIEKMEAHRRGVLHQAVSVFVFDAKGRLLIQRRARDKYHCGGLWANTCCTHPHFGETHAGCAARRLQEELGAVLPLRPTAVVQYKADVGGGLWEHEEVAVFRGDAGQEGLSLALNSAEVEETRWVALSDLTDQVAAAPERFTPWFRIYLKRWDELALA